MYAERIGSQQDAAPRASGASSGKIYSYRHTLNGFAARMTAAQAEKSCARTSRSCGVWEDERNGPGHEQLRRCFLGLLKREEWPAHEARPEGRGHHHRRDRLRHRAGASVARRYRLRRAAGPAGPVSARRAAPDSRPRLMQQQADRRAFLRRRVSAPTGACRPISFRRATPTAMALTPPPPPAGNARRDWRSPPGKPVATISGIAPRRAHRGVQGLLASSGRTVRGLHVLGHRRGGGPGRRGRRRHHYPSPSARRSSFRRSDSTSPSCSQPTPACSCRARPVTRARGRKPPRRASRG